MGHSVVFLLAFLTSVSLASHSNQDYVVPSQSRNKPLVRDQNHKMWKKPGRKSWPDRQAIQLKMIEGKSAPEIQEFEPALATSVNDRRPQVVRPKPETIVEKEKLRVANNLPGKAISHQRVKDDPEFNKSERKKESDEAQHIIDDLYRLGGSQETEFSRKKRLPNVGVVNHTEEPSPVITPSTIPNEEVSTVKTRVMSKTVHPHEAKSYSMSDDPVTAVIDRRPKKAVIDRRPKKAAANKKDGEDFGEGKYVIKRFTENNVVLRGHSDLTEHPPTTTRVPKVKPISTRETAPGVTPVTLRDGSTRPKTDMVPDQLKQPKEEVDRVIVVSVPGTTESDLRSTDDTEVTGKYTGKLDDVQHNVFRGTPPRHFRTSSVPKVKSSVTQPDKISSLVTPLTVNNRDSSDLEKNKLSQIKNVSLVRSGSNEKFDKVRDIIKPPSVPKRISRVPQEVKLSPLVTPVMVMNHDLSIKKNKGLERDSSFSHRTKHGHPMTKCDKPEQHFKDLENNMVPRPKAEKMCKWCEIYKLIFNEEHPVLESLLKILKIQLGCEISSIVDILYYIKTRIRSVACWVINQIDQVQNKVATVKQRISPLCEVQSHTISDEPETQEKPNRWSTVGKEKLPPHKVYKEDPNMNPLWVSEGHIQQPTFWPEVKNQRPSMVRRFHTSDLTSLLKSLGVFLSSLKPTEGYMVDHNMNPTRFRGDHVLHIWPGVKDRRSPPFRMLHPTDEVSQPSSLLHSEDSYGRVLTGFNGRSL
uniref:Uncharacterized protein n=1 Tax=Lygus hesperus TaxID=30085 RepID=A0A0K8SNN2_LYGHE